ncbi:MAG: glutathione peroxidase [Chitinophagaceae bacterium]|nr:MAG: glutathione peroxidase [Chitinophagaceae bacterium]
MLSKSIFFTFISFIVFLNACQTGTTVGSAFHDDNNQRTTMPNLYNIEVENIYGEKLELGQFKDNVLVIVNVASKCGLTPQYEELQAFYEEYNSLGVEVLGFPANNFMNQEPGSDEEILEFCQANFGVSFPMFSKISVKGSDQHPLYTFLTKKEKNGVLESDVSWNFQKYIIGKDGVLIATVAPRTSIFDDEVLKIIKKEL